MLFLGLLNVFKLLAIAIGAGASTVAIAQSLAAARDNKISKDEQDLLQVVMIVIRAAVLLLFLSQAWFTAIYFNEYNIQGNYNIAFSNIQSLTWLLLAVLFVCFVFIDRGIISRKIGVAVQISTWYSLIFVWAWPSAFPIQIDSFVFAYTLFATASVFIVDKFHLFTIGTQDIPRK